MFRRALLCAAEKVTRTLTRRAMANVFSEEKR